MFQLGCGLFDDGRLFVCRFYNNHNSNAVSFHRIRHFRQYANLAWAQHTEEYATGTSKVLQQW